MARLFNVRPLYDVRRMAAWALIWGVVSGIILNVLYHFLRDIIFYTVLSGVVSIVALQVALLAFTCALSIPIGLYFLRRCQRPAVVACSGQIFGTCLLLGYATSSWYANPIVLQYGRDAFAVLAIVVLSAAMGMVFALAYLILRQLVIACGFNILEQSGSMCWSCGYLIGCPPLSDRCPECGYHTRGLPHRIARLANNRRHLGFAVAVTVLLCLAIVGVMRGIRTFHSIPTAVKTIPGANRSDRMPMLRLGINNGAVTLAGSWETSGVSWRLANHPEKSLVLCMKRDSCPEQPSMQLQLVASAGNSFTYGDPVIISNLTPLQAQQVSSQGVPAKLIEAIVELASQEHWTPLLSKPNTFGRFVEMDATPYFSGDNTTRDDKLMVP